MMAEAIVRPDTDSSSIRSRISLQGRRRRPASWWPGSLHHSRLATVHLDFDHLVIHPLLIQLDVQESEKVALIYATDTEQKEEVSIRTISGTHTEKEIAEFIKTANEKFPEARAERQTKKVKSHTPV